MWPLAALVIVGVAFVAYFLYDLSRSRVRYLPKWAWGVISVVSVPLGGLVYLLIGRADR